MANSSKRLKEKENYSRDVVTTLPDELVVEIFKKIYNKIDFVNMSHTCRKFQRVSQGNTVFARVAGPAFRIVGWEDRSQWPQDYYEWYKPIKELGIKWLSKEVTPNELLHGCETYGVSIILVLMRLNRNKKIVVDIGLNAVRIARMFEMLLYKLVNTRMFDKRDDDDDSKVQSMNVLIDIYKIISAAYHDQGVAKVNEYIDRKAWGATRRMYIRNCKYMQRRVHERLHRLLSGPAFTRRVLASVDEEGLTPLYLDHWSSHFDITDSSAHEKVDNYKRSESCGVMAMIMVLKHMHIQASYIVSAHGFHYLKVMTTLTGSLLETPLLARVPYTILRFRPQDEFGEGVMNFRKKNVYNKLIHELDRPNDGPMLTDKTTYLSNIFLKRVARDLLTHAINAQITIPPEVFKRDLEKRFYEAIHLPIPIIRQPLETAVAIQNTRKQWNMLCICFARCVGIKIPSLTDQ